MIDKYTEENIKAIYEQQQLALEAAPWTQRVAHKIAFFSGTVLFIALHLLLFGSWIILNITHPEPIDPYPFTFLTMAVSLESIFLSAFVMLSQNNLSTQAELRHNLDLQVNLLAERESTAMIRALLLLAKQLNIDQDQLELQQFAEDTNPKEVLEKIAQVQNTSV